MYYRNRLSTDGVHTLVSCHFGGIAMKLIQMFRFLLVAAIFGVHGGIGYAHNFAFTTDVPIVTDGSTFQVSQGTLVFRTIAMGNDQAASFATRLVVWDLNKNEGGPITTQASQASFNEGYIAWRDESGSNGSGVYIKPLFGEDMQYVLDLPDKYQWITPMISKGNVLLWNQHKQEVLYVYNLETKQMRRYSQVKIVPGSAKFSASVVVYMVSGSVPDSVELRYFNIYTGQDKELMTMRRGEGSLCPEQEYDVVGDLIMYVNVAGGNNCQLRSRNISTDRDEVVETAQDDARFRSSKVSVGGVGSAWITTSVDSEIPQSIGWVLNRFTGERLQVPVTSGGSVVQIRLSGYYAIWGERGVDGGVSIRYALMDPIPGDVNRDGCVDQDDFFEIVKMGNDPAHIQEWKKNKGSCVSK
jgi:hypothetical protein